MVKCYKNMFFIKIWSVKYMSRDQHLKSTIELPSKISVWSNFEFNCICLWQVIKEKCFLRFQIFMENFWSSNYSSIT